MTTWSKFLKDHAKFPFPVPFEGGYADTTDISQVEVGLLPKKWKAQYAVQDDALAQKLCQTLDQILGETPITEDTKQLALAHFAPRLEYFGSDNVAIRVDNRWSGNKGEATARTLLDIGVLGCATFCLSRIFDEKLKQTREHTAEGYSGVSSRVNYHLHIGAKQVALLEAKSPLVLKLLGASLPATGRISLDWQVNQSLRRKILQTVALYLGLRKMQWLFLSSHNDWVICRLVSDNTKPFLVYSPCISIENSSVPFRAFLGAILSVREDVPVQASVPSDGPDVISEEEANGSPLSSPEVDNCNDPTYEDHSNVATIPRFPVTRSQTAAGGPPLLPSLMITSSPRSPESHQVWIHLRSLPDSIFVFPLYDKNGNKNRRLWLTHMIGFGSTGTVWKCSDDIGGLYVTKVVEFLHRSDEERQGRFRNEFDVYLTLEMAHQTGQLCNRITPHCYGAFEGDRISVLVLDLCDDTLKGWDKLNISERTQVYGLIHDLHSIGIIHANLEPWNFVRIPGGQFHLVDFSESRRHTCIEFQDKSDEQSSTQVKHYKCPELQAMRKVLKPLRT